LEEKAFKIGFTQNGTGKKSWSVFQNDYAFGIRRSVHNRRDKKQSKNRFGSIKQVEIFEIFHNLKL